jgi:hypothetical protein
MFARSDSSLRVSFPAGNNRYRDAITYARKEYIEAADSRFEKSLVVDSIIDPVRAAGGRFLKWDLKLGEWSERTDQDVKDKVNHALRHARGSNKSKNQKDDDTDDKNKKRKAVSSYESKNQKDEDKEKNKKQKAERIGRPRSEQEDSGDSYGSSGTAPRSVHESLTAVSGRPMPSVASISGPAVPSHVTADTAVAAGSIDDDGHDHQDQQFLDEIDAVLGPLPSDTRDPLELYPNENDFC